jgi:hypothetical protein
VKRRARLDRGRLSQVGAAAPESQGGAAGTRHAHYFRWPARDRRRMSCRPRQIRRARQCRGARRFGRFQFAATAAAFGGRSGLATLIKARTSNRACPPATILNFMMQLKREYARGFILIDVIRAPRWRPPAISNTPVSRREVALATELVIQPDYTTGKPLASCSTRLSNSGTSGTPEVASSRKFGDLCQATIVS